MAKKNACMFSVEGAAAGDDASVMVPLLLLVDGTVEAPELPAMVIDELGSVEEPPTSADDTFLAGIADSSHWNFAVVPNFFDERIRSSEAGRAVVARSHNDVRGLECRSQHRDGGRSSDVLPSGVLGNVKVTSDLQDVAGAVTVRNDPNDHGKSKNGALNVTSVSGMNGGNLLTEITLSSNNLGVLIISQSAQVVVEGGVLASDLVIDIGGSSALFVSASTTNLDLEDLTLTASDTASVQIDAKSLSMGVVTMDVGGSATVSVLAPTLQTSDIIVTAGNDGTACFAATDASVDDMTVDDGSKVSFPNSSKKFGTTAKFQCDNFKVPTRKASSMTSSKKPASSQKAVNGAAKGEAAVDEDYGEYGDSTW